MEVSPPFAAAAAAASHGGMEARARNKYHGLLLDYEDLLKVTAFSLFVFQDLAFFRSVALLIVFFV